MTEGANRTALIVGAGIGGLAAALALRRARWNIRVFERAQNPRELGFVLLLAPNAMLTLRELGLADAVASDGMIAERGEMRTAEGKLLRRLDAASIGAALGAPTVCVLRPVLHGLLLDAVGSVALELSSEAVGFTEVGSTVTLTLGDGRTVTGDMLIGADGVRSTVRRLLYPDEPPPRASGLFALRGVAVDVAHGLGELSGVQHFGRGWRRGWLARANALCTGISRSGLRKSIVSAASPNRLRTCCPAASTRRYARSWRRRSATTYGSTSSSNAIP